MLNLKIALRFLLHKPLKTLVLLFVIISGAGIFYFVYNASHSLKKLVLTTSAEINSHIFINDNISFNSHEDESVNNFRNELFKKDKRITDIAYSYSLNGIVTFSTTPYPRSIVLKGVDFEVGKNIQNITQRINNFKNNQIPNDTTLYDAEVAIGSMFAERLGYKNNAIGKTFDYIYNNNVYKFLIVAVYKTDQIDLSLNTIFTTINTTQKISNLKQANAIEIRTNNPLNSVKVLNNIEDTILKHYPNSTISQWQEGNHYIVNAIYIEDVSVLIIQIFTALAITFGISGILLFNIREKMNQIGILKALGMTNNDTKKIFLYQVIILSILGISLGLIFGNFLVITFMKVFRRPNSNAALIVLTKGLINKYSLTTFIVMFTSNVLGAIFPIRIAKNMKIIEVIKNE